MWLPECAACNCSALGSLSPECDDVTGMCACRANVTGDKCDFCLPQHYGHFTGRRSCYYHQREVLTDY